jgi:hypothetical protein
MMSKGTMYAAGLRMAGLPTKQVFKQPPVEGTRMDALIQMTSSNFAKDNTGSASTCAMTLAMAMRI